MPKYKDEKPFNPFLPPDPNLKVLELDRHIVVLNKYCILPRHFLLVSKGNSLVCKVLIVEFESQASDLSEDDVQKTWECLAEMEKENGRWLAFYNCGEFSGARYFIPGSLTNPSQQHKHLQFIPLPPKDEFSPFPDHLIENNKDHDKSIPFQHYISPLPENKTPSALYGTYQRLLQQANPETRPNFSYNFVMTTQWMFIAPRTKDDYIGEGYKIAVNSTGMVGLLLTKSEEETAFLERISPSTVLAHVGKPWSV